MPQAQLLYPGLARFYEAMLPVAETLMRVVVGVMFLMHVSVKFHLGANTVAESIFAKNGIEPALLWTYVVMFLELFGGVCLVVGLFYSLCRCHARRRNADSADLRASAKRVCGRSRRI
jgi:hypothetical protein